MELGAGGGSGIAYPHAVAYDPDPTDDEAGTGGHGVFLKGDEWVNTATQTLFLCEDSGVSAAKWTTLGGGEDTSTVANAPVSELVTDDLSHGVLNGFTSLVVGATYKVTLKNASVADGGNPTNFVEGWLKCAAAASPLTAEGGQPLQVNVPVLVQTVTGKTNLYFMRNPDTPYNCRVFVTRTDA